MSCSICLQAYTEDRRPRILSCGHYYCSPCLEDLHSVNRGVIRCPQCGGEEYSDVEKLIIVLGLEARVTNLSLKGTQEEAVLVGNPVKGVESSWGSCPLHEIPMSSWCQTCHLSLCDECNQLHLGRGHEVIDQSQTRDLLLSNYDSCSRRSFYQWLCGVKRATHETIEAAEALLPLLKPMLLTVQNYISQMEDQKQDVETTSSLKTLKHLMEESSQWWKRTQLAAQQKVDNAVSDLGRLESSMAELRRLQREIEDGFAQGGGGTAASFPEEKEEEEEREVVAPPRAASAWPRIVAQRGPVSLSPLQTATLDLPPDLGARCMAALHIQVTKIQRKLLCVGFSVTYENHEGRPLFWTCWHLGQNSVRMVSYDPVTGGVETEGPKRAGFYFAPDVVHQIRIVEDAARYAVLLDGLELGHVEKAGHRPPAAARVTVKNAHFQMDISRFHVEAEDVTV